jgi:hypothetical protein
MKKSFVQELGDHLFDETIENSYYNDECDVECYTPDYDAAYQYIRRQPQITKAELSETYKVENSEGDGYGDDEGKVAYTGIDLLKLAINGDFDGDNNQHSSELDNLKMCLSLIEKTKGDKSIWEYKKNTKPEKCQGYSEQEYKQNICNNHNLTEMVAARAESVAQRSGAEGLKLAAKVGDKLRGYKGFEGKDKCDLVKSSEATKSNINRVAVLIKNKSYDKLASIQNYELRVACSRHILYGKSGDPTLDEMVDSIKPIKEILESRDKNLEL